MYKELAVIVVLVLAAAFATPVYGAAFKVGGKYVGAITYDGEETVSASSITSINPGGMTSGIDLPGMSTLCLDFDFIDEGLLEAHLPLILFKEVDESKLALILNPDDEYCFVYRGNPFTLSFTSATSGDYAFTDLKDPLGLVKEIDTEDMAVLKLAGQPRGMDMLGYLITAVFTDKKGNVRESQYGAMRSTCELPYGVCLGLTGGIHRQSHNSGDDRNIDVDRNKNIDRNTNMDRNTNIDKNISIDLSIPIPISRRATLQSALAISTGREAGNNYGPKSALSIKVRKLELGNITLLGDLIAVEPGFVVVAHKKDSSDAFDYQGKRYLRGEGKTVLHLFDKDVKTTISNERITNYDGSFDLEKGSSKNKLFGEVEFGLSSGVTVTFDGYLDKTLADTGHYKDDHTTRIRAKMSYESPEGNEIWGRLWQVEKEHKEDQGLAHKIEGGVKVKSGEYGEVEGKAGYERGTLTFPSYTSVGKYTAKAYGEIYGKLELTATPDEAERVDIFLAGLAKYAHRITKNPEITLAAYGEIDVTFDHRFNTKTAVLLATEPKKTSHYAPAVYNKLGYELSDNTSLALEYTLKGNKGTVHASYTIMIGNAGLELGYGKTGLRDECTDTGHKGKPWAWLCSAEIEPKPRFFTVTLTIPF